MLLIANAVYFQGFLDENFLFQALVDIHMAINVLIGIDATALIGVASRIVLIL